MNRFSIIAALVALAIITAFLMFLTLLITSVLGSAAIYFVWIVCIPIEIISLFGGLLVVLIIVGNTLHSLKLRRTNEDHYYQVVREQRELNLQKRKIQQHLYRLRTSRNIHSSRPPKLRH